MAKKRIFVPEIGHGIIGMQINLNLQQCISIALFAETLDRAKQDGIFNYPDNLQPFFDQFKQFGIVYNPDLFSECEEVKSTGLYVGEKPKSLGE